MIEYQLIQCLSSSSGRWQAICDKTTAKKAEPNTMSKGQPNLENNNQSTQ